MRKIILIMLCLGLGFFLYLLNEGEIQTTDFSIKKLQGETAFIIKKSEDDTYKDSSVIYSDIFAVLKGKEFKVFSFYGNNFDKLLKAEYPLRQYSVPADAIDAVTGSWLGNRYIFYMISKDNPNTGKKTFEIYKTEYPTDATDKPEYYKIKSIEEYDVDKTFEVRY
jgi:hypothetical protein